MKFTTEQIKKAKTAKSAEEIVEMAKAEGIEITLEQAKIFFDVMGKSSEMTDEELVAVAGGKGEQQQPKYHSHQYLYSGNMQYIITAEGAYSAETGFTYYVAAVQENGGHGTSVLMTEFQLDSLFHT